MDIDDQLFNFFFSQTHTEIQPRTGKIKMPGPTTAKLFKVWALSWGQLFYTASPSLLQPFLPQPPAQKTASFQNQITDGEIISI